MPSFLLCFATSSAVNSCVLGPEDEGALAPSAAFVEVSSEAAAEAGVEDEGAGEDEGAEEGAGAGEEEEERVPAKRRARIVTHHGHERRRVRRQRDASYT